MCARQRVDILHDWWRDVGRKRLLDLPCIVQQPAELGDLQPTQQPSRLIDKRLGLIVVAQRITILQAAHLVFHQVVAHQRAVADIADQQAALQFQQRGWVGQHRLDDHMFAAEMIDRHAAKRSRVLILSPAGDAQIDALDPIGQLGQLVEVGW